MSSLYLDRMHATWLLPDREESNLSPEAAAALWPKLEAAAEKLGLLLGSPAAAPCGANCVTRSPFDWCGSHVSCMRHQRTLIA